MLTMSQQGACGKARTSLIPTSIEGDRKTNQRKPSGETLRMLVCKCVICMHFVFDQDCLFCCFYLAIHFLFYQQAYKNNKMQKEDKTLRYYNHIEQHEIIKAKIKVKVFRFRQKTFRLCILWLLSTWIFCLLRLGVEVS